jgi:hypothetical protein
MTIPTPLQCYYDPSILILLDGPFKEFQFCVRIVCLLNSEKEESILTFS